MLPLQKREIWVWCLQLSPVSSNCSSELDQRLLLPAFVPSSAPLKCQQTRWLCRCRRGGLTASHAGHADWAAVEQPATRWVSPLPRCCSSHHGSGLKQQRCHEINRKQIHLQLPRLAKGHAGSLFRASSCRCCREDREPLWELGALLGCGHGCHSPLWRPLGLL